MYLRNISRGVEGTDKTRLEGGSCDDLPQVRWNSDIMWSCSSPNMEVLEPLVLPSTTSITHRPTASIYLNGLEASMILLTQPYIHLYCPRSLQVQSLTTNCTVWLLTHSPRCPSWYEPPTSPSLLTTNCPDSPRTSTDTGLNTGILKFQPSQSPASSPPVSPLLLFPGCDHCRGAAQGKLNLLSLLFASLLIVVIVIRVGAMS